MDNQRKQAAGTAMLLYGLMMLWLLFGQRVGFGVAGAYRQQLAKNCNLIPLHTIRNYLRAAHITEDPALLRHIIVNLAGNVVMFLPLGLLPPMLWRPWRGFWHCWLRGAGCILVVELLQLFSLLGRFDVDDLLLNLLGIALGYGIGHLARVFP